VTIVKAACARLFVASLIATASTAALAGSYVRTDSGIVVTPDVGQAKAVRLLVYGHRIVRVTESPSGSFELPASLVVETKPANVPFTVSQANETVTLTTAGVRADVSLHDGTVRFTDATGELDLAETQHGFFTPVTIDGKPYFSILQQFNRGTVEGLYGLGQHQNGQMNYNGEDVLLQQHNMEVAIPFLVSTRNYGILWDNNSITRFGNPRPYQLAGSVEDGLAVTGVDGASGWTAAYYVNRKLLTERQEPAIDYRYLENRSNWPLGTRTPDLSGTVPGLRVVWTGRVVPQVSGLQRFRVYGSSYFKVFVNGRKVLDRWRQNWNPFFHNFDVPLAAGKSADLRIEWEPDSGYIGLLHNNPQPELDRHSIQLWSEAAQAIDYYYVGGNSIDDVIAGYRQLTGKAAMLPKWAYGFWQSRQRYETQDQLLGVLREYRKRGLPLDNIVQDWLYWPQDEWGCQCFDPARFPDAKGMVDEIHRSGAHVMISVWAKYYKGLPNYNELDAVGGIYRRMADPRPDEPKDASYIKDMYRDWVGPGYFNAFYDPYNPQAKSIYWRQVRDGIASKGFDAFWLDSDEPDFHSNISDDETARRMGPTVAGPARAFFNSYPLVHVDGVYQGMTAFKPDVRPFILTRSAFAGIQRDAAAVWSGDVASRWDNLREQIAAGINFSMSGVPNWSHDIGGYTMEQRFQKPSAADLDEWRELNTRWFQFGAFSPIFRSHGENIKREIFEMSPEGSPTYNSMVWYDRLRYRLMPYIYTLGADVFFEDGTIMRGLAMDFAADKRVWNIGDEYMFGPAFLVAPVTEYKARSRRLYLPAGSTWYDFYTGRSVRGGRSISAAAPYERMPLFVRAGSIVPTGPAIEYTGESSGQPLTLNVYTGADGTFSMYEDDGVSRQYLNGRYSRIPLSWNEATNTLTLGAREGGYPAMASSREIHIRWMKPGAPRALAFDAKPDATVTYNGAPLTVRMR
jgi:alpha-D-xyloside xylohydrolase